MNPDKELVKYVLTNVEIDTKYAERNPSPKQIEHIINKINSVNLGTEDNKLSPQSYYAAFVRLCDLLPAQFQLFAIEINQLLSEQNFNDDYFLSAIKRLAQELIQFNKTDSKWKTLALPVLKKIQYLNSVYFPKHKNFFDLK